jgi:hypothetical protein
MKRHNKKVRKSHTKRDRTLVRPKVYNFNTAVFNDEALRSCPVIEINSEPESGLEQMTIYLVGDWKTPGESIHPDKTGPYGFSAIHFGDELKVVWSKTVRFGRYCLPPHLVQEGAVQGEEAKPFLKDDGHWYVEAFGEHYRTCDVIWSLHHGELPKQGLEHVDGDRSNNRIENLRPKPAT